jgi:hypothetical protein
LRKFVLSQAFVVAQAVASVIGAYGLGGFPHNGEFDFGGAGWGWVLLGWIWVIIWYCGVVLCFLTLI